MTNSAKMDFVLMMVEAQLAGAKSVQKQAEIDGHISSGYINGYAQATQDIMAMIQRTMKAGAENE
jgi:hypothetical protein